MSQDVTISPKFIPLISTSPPVLPRLQGDGMDSETLKTNPQPQMPSISRHKNLTQAFDSTTVSSRTTSQKKNVVPKEPVKAAVKPILSENNAQENGQKKSEMKHIQSAPMGFYATQNSQLGHSYSQPTFLQQTNLKKARKSLNFNNTFSQATTSQSHKPPSYNSNAYVNVDKSVTKTDVQDDDWNRVSFKVPENKLGSVESVSSNASTVSSRNSFTVVDMKSPQQSNSQVIDMNGTINENQPPSPPEEEREVEGSRERSVRDELQKELAELKEQLDVQSTVNADLKKLLVASIGDDLHHKVEAIVRTKAQLTTDMYGYDKKQKEDYEDLDNLSIQADMWKSKFSASRVFIDQLSKEKDLLSERWDSSKTAIQHLMSERQQLFDNLKETHRYLKLLRDSFDPRAAKKPPTTIPNVLELARTNLRLADAIKFRLLSTAPIIPAALDAGVQNGMSPAERLAYQLLDQDSCSLGSSPGSLPPHLPSQLNSSFARFHPSVRYDNITFDCCKKCKGEIKVV